MTATATRLVAKNPTLSSEEVADITAALSATYSRDTSAAGVLVCDGMGTRLSIDRGALVVSDGMGPHRRERRFEKATHGLIRVVVLASTGSVSIDALRWCSRLGIGLVMLAPNGTAQLVSTPRMTDDARIRRCQAKAPDEPYGIDIARYLLTAKLQGQASNLKRYFPNAAETTTTIDALVEVMSTIETIDELRQLEASAAALYFGSWRGQDQCSPRFASQDRGRVPPHWLRYEGRRSVLASSASNRKAERPVNAMLNYLNSLAEAEAILACQVVGLDPGLGIVHADNKGRASLALDLLEPVRPKIESFLLDLIEHRTFRKTEFVETTDGQVRLMAPLTHELAETMPRWAKLLAPNAEKVAHVLGKAMTGKYIPATPLTGTRYRDAQAVVKARKAVARKISKSSKMHQRPIGDVVLPTWSCPDCGGQVTNPRHVRCDSCIAADPSQTLSIRQNRGLAIAARKAAIVEWERMNPGIAYDPELFTREILPKLERMKLREIVEVTGLSKSYASTVRSGKYTPHVSTWGPLALLVGLSLARTVAASCNTELGEVSQ